MKSLAVVNYAPEENAVELREIDIPVLGDEDVLLEVKNIGVCGSDLHQWKATHSWMVNYPVVLGHEFCGIIADKGKRVNGWNYGERVVSETAAIINLNNPMSRAGLYNLDPGRKGFGYGVNGAMTKYVKVPARCLHRIPGVLPFKEACLTEPCCVAYSAVVGQSHLKPGDRVIVLGPGTIGLLCAAMAIICGAEVAVVGLPCDASRLEIAREYGCEIIVGDASAWASARDGLGADCVIDAAGTSVTLQTAMQLVRPNGQITKVGWGPQSLGYSLDPLVQKGIRLHGSFSHNWPMWERVITLLDSGKLNVKPLIGGEWPITQWQEAFEKMHDGEIVKSVLQAV